MVGHCSKNSEHHQYEADVLRVTHVAIGPGLGQRPGLLRP